MARGSSIRAMLAGQATANSRSSPARRCSSSRSRSARVQHQATEPWSACRDTGRRAGGVRPRQDRRSRWGSGPSAGRWTGRSRPGATRTRGPVGAPAAGSASPLQPVDLDAWPRWELPLSTTQNTRMAERRARLPSPARPAHQTARCRWWPRSGQTAWHMHVPGHQVGQRAATLALVLNPHRPGSCWRPGEVLRLLFRASRFGPPNPEGG
jgi:hypothetical protein